MTAGGESVVCVIESAANETIGVSCILQLTQILTQQNFEIDGFKADVGPVRIEAVWIAIPGEVRATLLETRKSQRRKHGAVLHQFDQLVNIGEAWESTVADAADL